MYNCLSSMYPNNLWFYLNRWYAKRAMNQNDTHTRAYMSDSSSNIARKNLLNIVFIYLIIKMLYILLFVNLRPYYCTDYFPLKS